MQCEWCEGEIGDQVRACKHCGNLTALGAQAKEPQKKQMGMIAKTAVVIGGVLAAGIALIFLIGSIPSESAAAVQETYPLAGPVIHVMILDRSKVVSGDDLPRLARDFCVHREVNGCFVWMYFDRSMAPLEGMGGETAKGDPVFSYTSNWNTGFEGKLWDCTIYPKESESDCAAPSHGGGS